jgi:hypothetical protein
MTGSESGARGAAWAAPGPWRLALLLTLGLRLLYSVLGLLLTPFLRWPPARLSGFDLTDALIQRSEGWRYALWGVWERFDTLWYLRIAEQGYYRPDAVVFYPLYPALVRAVRAVVHEPVAAGLIVSTAATFFLLWAYLKLLSLDLDQATVRRAAWFYALWPAAFIFFAAYSESLVIALVLWAIYFARTERWWAAALCGLAAPLAKAVGVAVIVPLAVLAWKRRSLRAAPLLLCLAGPFLFLAGLAATGHPLPAEVYPKYWDVHVAWPWTTLAHGLRLGSRYAVLYLHAALLAFAVGCAFMKRLRSEYALYTACVLLLLLSKDGPPAHLPWSRYILVLFMAPAGLACRLKRPLPVMLVSGLFLFANLVLFWSFAEWLLVV